ncbi:hypothetical protein [Actinocorallia libanotica]|uniref:Uncharacterized protein n=1 Tax=Actinocorallia libanotica TaxID=46162 RepID=A0ABN1Q0F2_9ACTN
MEAPEFVYIPEFVDVSDNPWDGRTRYGVHLTLESALKALAFFGEEGDPMVATPEEQEAEDGTCAYMVHMKSEEPDDDGGIWIFKEKVTIPESGSDA